MLECLSRVVLHNCEHVVLEVRAALEELVTRCADLVILATSRERLGIPDEISWSLPPMAIPKPDDVSEAALLKTEAVALFCARAQLTGQVGPGAATTPS